MSWTKCDTLQHFSRTSKTPFAVCRPRECADRAVCACSSGQFGSAQSFTPEERQRGCSGTRSTRSHRPGGGADYVVPDSRSSTCKPADRRLSQVLTASPAVFRKMTHRLTVGRLVRAVEIWRRYSHITLFRSRRLWAKVGLERHVAVGATIAETGLACGSNAIPIHL